MSDKRSTAQAFLDDITNSLEVHSHSIGKGTVKYRGSNTGSLIYVSPREKDPVTALMMAAVDILIERGNLDVDERVKIRRVSEIVAPGHEVFWEICGNNGERICGYAATEEAAMEAVRDALLQSMAPNG